MYFKLAICLTAFVGLAAGAPNHLKTVVLDTGSGGGVAAGASLSASAVVPVVPVKAVVVDTPVVVQTEAPVLTSGNTASLSGSSAGGGVSFSASAAHTGPTFFDRIFNIPIAILHSVNDHLNTRGPVRKTVLVAGGTVGGSNHGVTVPVGEGGASASASFAGASSGGAAVSHDVGVRSGATTVAVAPVAGLAAGGGFSAGGGVAAGSGLSTGTVLVAGQKTPAFYDSVFNIPITALRSVNQLLNG